MAQDFQSVNAAEVAKAKESDQFIHKSQCGCGLPVYTFHVPGQILEGRLRPCPHPGSNPDHPVYKCIHIFFYDPDTKKEIGVAVRCSGMLWHAVNHDHRDHGRLWGRWIKITYVGSQKTRFKNAKKIYDVAYDKGSISENFVEVTRYDKKTKTKAKEDRKIRRPLKAKVRGRTGAVTSNASISSNVTATATGRAKKSKTKPGSSTGSAA